MPAIIIKAFGGLQPLVDALQLPQSGATVAKNVRLTSGALAPLKGLSLVKPLTKSSPQTIYRYGNNASESLYWLEFLGDTDVIPSPVTADPYARIYWSDGQSIKYGPSSLVLSGVSFPGGGYTLGIPKPVSRPTVSGSSYSKASASFTFAQIDALTVGDVLTVAADGGSESSVTLAAGGAGKVTPASLAAQLNALAAIDAEVQGTGVMVTTVSSTKTSGFVIKKRSTGTQSYAAGQVTYTNFLGPVAGTSGPPETAATMTVSAAQIASLAVNSRLAVKVNSNAEVAVTLQAGANTFPEAVTATSLRNALASVSGMTATVNDSSSQTVTLTTIGTGNTTSIQLRVVNPTTTYTYSTLLTASNDSVDSLAETRTYAYTYVSAYGEEGPPSTASDLVTVAPGQATSISGLSVGPGGAVNIQSKRLYRSSTSAAGTVFQLVPVTWVGQTTATTDIPMAITQVTDSAKQESLGETLQSENWVAPPAGLQGLKLTPSGAAVGFLDNTVYMSEPFLPYAWPHEYPVEAKIVGLGVFRQSVVVLTNGYPYMLTGVDPQAMSMERIELPQACVSKRSIVDMGNGVLYASPDGLVSIGSGGIEIVTKSLLTREQWQEYQPSTMFCAVHDNRCHVAYTKNNGTRGILVFDFSGQGSVMTDCNINESVAISAMYSDPRTDTLYVAQPSNLQRFNAGGSLFYVWRSKKFRGPFHMNFSKAQVIADAYPVTFKLYGDGVLRHTKSVSDGGIFTLPGGYRAVDWEIQIEGDKTVTQVSIATSAEEIRGS